MSKLLRRSQQRTCKGDFQSQICVFGAMSFAGGRTLGGSDSEKSLLVRLYTIRLRRRLLPIPVRNAPELDKPHRGMQRLVYVLGIGCLCQGFWQLRRLIGSSMFWVTITCEELLNAVAPNSAATGTAATRRARSGCSLYVEVQLPYFGVLIIRILLFRVLF